MRRFTRSTAIIQAIRGGATNSTATATQAALHSSRVTSSTIPLWLLLQRANGLLSSFSNVPTVRVACTRLFSAAASSATEEDVTTTQFNPKDVVLYQYEACPFCNKVRAFLDYYNIPYKIVEVNPINKKEIKWSEYKKVPILSVDGEKMVDSTDIIDKLFKRIHPNKSGTDNTEESKWRGWVDNHLVHVLSPNIYRSPSEALESFNYITSQGNFSFTERLVAKYAGAAAMYFVSKKLKKRHNITDERGALYEAAETWVNALDGRQFLGGAKPNLADLAVFGVLRPIRHLKSGRDMVENTKIGDWYAGMEAAMGTSSRIKL